MLLKRLLFLWLRLIIYVKSLLVYTICFKRGDNMFSRLHTFMGGTHIDAAKNLTAELPIEAIPAPDAYRSPCQAVSTAGR